MFDGAIEKELDQHIKDIFDSLQDNDQSKLYLQTSSLWWFFQTHEIRMEEMKVICEWNKSRFANAVLLAVIDVHNTRNNFERINAWHQLCSRVITYVDHLSNLQISEAISNNADEKPENT